MGNDGGSIPTRRELVKEAARNKTTTELKESQYEQQEYHWTTDPISQKPLARPVVSDANGTLYNKDTILEYLVEGGRDEEAETATRGAVKSLKDVVEVKFEVDAEATAKAKREVWVCPVTGDELGPSSRAVYLVPCGHAFSGTAVKEVLGEKCLTCETEYAPNDVIPILPTSETDIARLLLRLKTLQEKGLTHSLKKASSGSKKRKKKDEDGHARESSAAPSSGTPSGNSDASGKKKKDAEAPINGHSNIKNASTASIAAKVAEEQERAKKRKLENDNVRSLFATQNPGKPQAHNTDFMTRGYSVPSATKR